MREEKKGDLDAGDYHDIAVMHRQAETEQRAAQVRAVLAARAA